MCFLSIKACQLIVTLNTQQKIFKKESYDPLKQFCLNVHLHLYI